MPKVPSRPAAGEAPTTEREGPPDPGSHVLVEPLPNFKAFEERERRLARAYWVLAQCNRALVRSRSEAGLLRQLCRILVQVGEYHMAWVGFAEDDAARTVRCAAQAGFSDGYLQSIRVTWGEDELGRGPTGTCIRTGKPVVNRNSETEPTFQPWRDQALERGFQSSIALPLQVGKNVVGALTVYSTRVDDFDAEERELLQRLAEDMAYGIGALRDRAERERAEQATAASEDLFRSAFEDSSVGKALTSPDGRYLRVNRALGAVLGYPVEELVGRRFSELTHPDDRQASEDAVRRMLGGEIAAVRLEKRYLRRDGSVVWGDVGISLVRGPDGSPLYFITEVQDVTARRHAEELLRQSQKMEAVGLLAGGIAHDFNNLLTVMLSSSAFALEQAPAEGSLRADIEDFRAAAEKARTVTRQLLAFSRQQVLDPVPLQLNQVVRDSERILRRLIGEHVELRTALAPDLGPIVADPGQMQQAILNLVINARDAMPRGGAVTLETTNVDRPAECSARGCPVGAGGCVRLAVEDSGAGMDEWTRSRIFEPFFTTKPMGKGTGLGLSTVFGIVRQCGGTIRVESEPGRGSRFEICFPRAVLPEVDAASVPRQARGAAPESPARTVLVVEDDEQVRRITVRMLQRAGFDVLAASGLEEAEARIREHPRAPSVLLTDVRMPAQSGPEVSAALSARIPGLRTIYMSGYSSEEIGDEGGLPPGTLLLQKPFAEDELAAKVRDAS